jgi:tryptophan-rich hypothetical protein
VQPAGLPTGLPPDLPFSPAAERNAAPILAVLARWLPAQARVLELASGTGQHARHLAAAQPGWDWQPTEARAEALPAIAARCTGLANVRAPLALDAMASPWPVPAAAFDALFVANLLHIAPWPVTTALMRGAANSLCPGGLLAVYGPFVVQGEPLAPSNAAFDADLRGRDPRWGLRTLQAVQAAARDAGLALAERCAMPANNLLLRFVLEPEPQPAHQPAQEPSQQAAPQPHRTPRLNPDKLLLSKWTAVQPQRREKHFIVTRLLRPEAPGQPPGPVIEVVIEAVHSGRSRALPWRELTDTRHWLQGWR